MPKPKIRNNSYWMARFKRDHRTLYDGVKAGEITVRQARQVAGLLRLPSKLDALKRAWKMASESDRKAFDGWRKIGAKLPVARRTVPLELDSEGKFTDMTCRRIRAILAANGNKMGLLMEELGYTRLNGSLGNAISRRQRSTPSPDLLRRVGKWLVTVEKSVVRREASAVAR